VNTLKGEMLRPVLAKQLEWFVRAIAVAAWEWHRPSTLFLDPETATRMAREECDILINALTYGVLVPALIEPVEIDFRRIFRTFFDDPMIGLLNSLHLAEILAKALAEALEV
jgi:hypothetical protein